MDRRRATRGAAWGVAGPGWVTCASSPEYVDGVGASVDAGEARGRTFPLLAAAMRGRSPRRDAVLSSTGASSPKARAGAGRLPGSCGAEHRARRLCTAHVQGATQEL